MKGYSSDTGTPPANDPVYWSRFEGDICFPCTKDKMVTEMSFYNGALQLLAVPHPTSTILCQWKVLNNKSYRTLNDTFFKENIIISGDTSHGFLYNQSLKVVTSERTGAEATDATKSFVFTKFKQGQDYAYGIDSGGTTWGEFYPIYVPPTCKTLKILGTPVSAVSPLASYLDLILPYYFEIGRTMEIDLTNCYVTSGTYNGYPTGGVIRLCSTCYGGTETKANAQAGLISTSSKYDFCPIIVETLSGSNSTQDIYYQLFAGQKYAITRIAANRWFVQEF